MMNEQNINEQLRDVTSFQGKPDEKLTFKIIVLKVMDKISRISWDGSLTYDRVSIFGNAVCSLFDLLYPHFDEPMRNDAEQYNALIKQWTLEYNHSMRNRKDWEADFDSEQFQYVQQKYEIYRQLFRSLNCFLARTGYLSMGKIQEDDE
jgi:hypothetical protein